MTNCHIEVLKEEGTNFTSTPKSHVASIGYLYGCKLLTPTKGEVAICRRVKMPSLNYAEK